MSKLRDSSTISPDDQRKYWNKWNFERRVGNWTKTQACSREEKEIIELVRKLGKEDLKILEVGCGSGWLCSELAAFGQVIGTDIANEVLGKSATADPRVSFVAGDFMALTFPHNYFDVVVAVEVLSHVSDQQAFVAKIAQLLRSGGHLALATQNRIVLSRWSKVVPQGPGQVRNWVDVRKLRKILGGYLEILELRSVVPVGDRGFMRLVNSYKLNKLLSVFLSESRIEAIKEQFFLGHSLIAFARKPI